MSKEIADAFGLHPDSLEFLECGEDVINARVYRSCEAWERKYAELAAESAECRGDVARCQYQIEQLLRIKPIIVDERDSESRLPP